MYNTYIGNNYKPQTAYVENNIYKIYDNRTFNNTSNIYKHINQYSTDVFNNYRANNTPNVKKPYSIFTNGVAINKHNTINTDGIYNISKTKLANFNGNTYFIKKIEHKNNITRHSPNNYEDNVIKKCT